MNEVNRLRKEKEVYKSYHCPGMPNYARRSKNCIFISIANSLKHEMSKSIGAYMLRKWGDVKFDKELVDMIDIIDVYVNKSLFKDFVKDKTNFITEVCPNSEPDRRVDLVSLKNGTRFEFETKDIDKGDCVTIRI